MRSPAPASVPGGRGACALAPGACFFGGASRVFVRLRLLSRGCRLPRRRRRRSARLSRCALCAASVRPASPRALRVVAWPGPVCARLGCRGWCRVACSRSAARARAAVLRVAALARPAVVVVRPARLFAAAAVVRVVRVLAVPALAARCGPRLGRPARVLGFPRCARSGLGACGVGACCPCPPPVAPVALGRPARRRFGALPRSGFLKRS